MKITITDKACGLEVGKEYDLCDMSATTLIQKRQAVAVKEIVIEAPIKEPKKTSKKTKKVAIKPEKGKTNAPNK